MRRERDVARSEFQRLVQNQELLAQTLALAEAAHEMAQEQSRAEIARRDTALAEAEQRYESSAIKSESSTRRSGNFGPSWFACGWNRAPPPTNGRVHAGEAAAGRARLDEGWTSHPGSECYRGARPSCLPQNQDSQAISERPLMLNSGTSRLSVYLPEEPPSREFPSDVDLGLVRAQVEL